MTSFYPWVSLEDAAGEVGRPYRTVQTWARRGKVRRVAVDGVVLVHVGDARKCSQARAVTE